MNAEMIPVVETFLRNEGLQAISDAAAEVLGNPFWIVDMNSKYLVHISGKTTDSVLLQENELGYAIDDVVRYTDQLNVRAQVNKSERAHLFTAYSKDKDVLSCAVKISNITVAFISSISENRPFVDADYETMKLIADIVSAELQKSSYYRDNKEMMYSYFLIDLLENRIRHDDIRQRLNVLGYRPKDLFYLLTVEFEHAENRSMVLHSIQEQLKFILPDSIYCLHNNHSIFLFSMSKQLTVEDSVYKRMEKFLNESNLKAALSDVVRDLSLIPRHYEKTLSALQFGHMSMPQKAVYRYSDLASLHAVSVLKNLVTYSDFCDGAIDKLLSYDSENHSNLTGTLYIYLKHNCNIVPASKDMGIHSNTLRNRIEKIKEVTGCDLGNGLQCFDLMLAIKIYHEYRKDNH